MSLDTAIKARLDTVEAVRKISKGRNYAVSAPRDAEYPLTTFELVFETTPHAMGSDAAYREARVQVNSFATSHTEANDLDEAVRAALSRFRGTAGGTVVQDVLAETAVDGFLPETEEGVYHRARDFRVFYEP